MRSVAMILGLLFLALCHPSLSQNAEANSTTTTVAPSATLPLNIDWQEVVYDLHRALELNCKPSNGADTASVAFAWQANGTDVAKVGALAGRYELKEDGAVLQVARSTEDDWGNYTCFADNNPARGFRVGARPVLRLPPNSNVVEGQKLKITCRVIGRPYPTVRWTYAQLGPNENASDVVSHFGERITLQDSAAGVPGGELLIEAAQRTDAGNYSCVAEGAAPVFTTLRVKDMYAALWPFLGICAEVFILCAIILVYEKRRTKPELDDSDTDNHDQKKS